MIQTPSSTVPSRPLWRVLLGVVAGFGAMGMLLAGSLTLAYNLLGEEGTFQPETFQVKPAWLITHVLVELACGLLAGLVSRWLGGTRAVCLLAALLFCLGAWGAWGKITEGDPGNERFPGETDSMEAANVAVSPTWKHLLAPVSLAGMALLAGLAPYRLRDGSKT
ncbi:MAG: hypothetical protein ACKOS8_18180 [Gemmataceae bacterium]